VLDLGVMVPAEKILKIAREEGCDIVGVSGLITPSLDEMVHLAKEMQRLGFHQPLLIGGATTSRIHTAVKIDRCYEQPVVHVSDASRAVGVLSQLLSPKQKPTYVDELTQTYERLRQQRQRLNRKRQSRTLLAARKNQLTIDWTEARPAKPIFLGRRIFDQYDLSVLIDCIDWTPFFRAWELKGKFPEILNRPVIGVEAKKLYDDAQRMLRQICEERWLQAKAVIGFYPANSRQDDILLFDDERREKEHTSFCFLRQQKITRGDQPSLCLADFIAPESRQVADYMGVFAVTAGLNIEALLARFERDQDDYQGIMLKALADRLAEAFAEHLHQRVRREFWAYVPHEDLDNDQLIDEQYQGIRPAPGYPACPDHTEKEKIWSLLRPDERAGIQLTESHAMYPAASVSGYYFSHPDSRYFGLGKIERDQVIDYAARKSLPVDTVEKLLSSSLAYDR